LAASKSETFLDAITLTNLLNRQYGSGYPGVAGRGVAGRGFPFVFWPLAWGGAVGFGAGAYLHGDEVILQPLTCICVILTSFFACIVVWQTRQ
jgi:hypothetical protein